MKRLNAIAAQVKREILTMRFRILNPAIVVLGLVAIVSTPAVARAADPDWKAVERELGKSGQIQPGEVFRIGMPRTDLAVTVRGVPVKVGSPSDRTRRSSRWETRRWSWAISSCSIKKCRP